MLASGKKWNKKEAQTGEATWQAHQPTTRESNGPGVMSFVVWPTCFGRHRSDIVRLMLF